MPTELRKRGVPPWEIAGFLGHSARDYATTEIYAEYAPEYLGAAGRAIETIFAELAPLLDFELAASAPEPVAAAKAPHTASPQPAIAPLRVPSVSHRVSRESGTLANYMIYGGKMVGPARLERATNSLKGSCSTS